MTGQTGTDKTAIVVGVGSEIGHRAASTLLAAGYRVAASADEPAALDAAEASFTPAYGDAFEPLLGRADNPALADWAIDEFRPDLLLLIADADEETAAREAFLWCRQVITSLLTNSTTIVISGHEKVRAIVEDAASQPELSTRFGISFLIQDDYVAISG